MIEEEKPMTLKAIFCLNLIDNFDKSKKGCYTTGSKKSITSYLKLRDAETSLVQYFKLYEDNDVGFNRSLQDLPESVAHLFIVQTMDDDCPTEEVQIDISKKELEAEIKNSIEILREQPKHADKKIMNARFNPALATKIEEIMNSLN